MYNEMDDNYDDVTISIFKSDLPTEHCLRKSLTGKPVTNIRQLMDRIDNYKRVEEDQLQGKGKEKIFPHKMNDFRSEPESVLSVPPRPRTYYRRLQEPMEPLGSVDPRREITAPFTSFQWSSRSDKLRTLERHIFKTSHGHDKCHPCRFGKNRLFSL